MVAVDVVAVVLDIVDGVVVVIVHSDEILLGGQPTTPIGTQSRLGHRKGQPTVWLSCCGRYQFQ